MGNSKRLFASIALGLLVILLLAAGVYFMVFRPLAPIPPNTSPLPTVVTKEEIKLQAAAMPDLRPTGVITLFWREGQENTDRFYLQYDPLTPPVLTLDFQLRSITGTVVYSQTITYISILTGENTYGLEIPYQLNFTQLGVFNLYYTGTWRYLGWDETGKTISGTRSIVDPWNPSADGWLFSNVVRIGYQVYVPIVVRSATPVAPVIKK